MAIENIVNKANDIYVETKETIELTQELSATAYKHSGYIYKHFLDRDAEHKGPVATRVKNYYNSLVSNTQQTGFINTVKRAVGMKTNLTSNRNNFVNQHLLKRTDTTGKSYSIQDVNVTPQQVEKFKKNANDARRMAKQADDLTTWLLHTKAPEGLALQEIFTKLQTSNVKKNILDKTFTNYTKQKNLAADKLSEFNKLCQDLTDINSEIEELETKFKTQLSSALVSAFGYESLFFQDLLNNCGIYVNPKVNQQGKLGQSDTQHNVTNPKYTINDLINLLAFKVNVRSGEKSFTDSVNTNFSKFLFTHSIGVWNAKEEYLFKPYGRIIADLMDDASIGDMYSKKNIISQACLSVTYALLDNGSKDFNLKKLRIKDESPISPVLAVSYTDENSANKPGSNFATGYMNSYPLNANGKQIYATITNYFTDLNHNKIIDTWGTEEQLTLKWNLVGGTKNKGTAYSNQNRSGIFKNIDEELKNFKPVDGDIIYTDIVGFNTSETLTNSIKKFSNNIKYFKNGYHVETYCFSKPKLSDFKSRQMVIIYGSTLYCLNSNRGMQSINIVGSVPEDKIKQQLNSGSVERYKTILPPVYQGLVNGENIAQELLESNYTKRKQTANPLHTLLDKSSNNFEFGVFSDKHTTAKSEFTTQIKSNPLYKEIKAIFSNIDYLMQVIKVNDAITFKKFTLPEAYSNKLPATMIATQLNITLPNIVDIVTNYRKKYDELKKNNTLSNEDKVNYSIYQLLFDYCDKHDKATIDFFNLLYAYSDNKTSVSDKETLFNDLKMRFNSLKEDNLFIPYFPLLADFFSTEFNAEKKLPKHIQIENTMDDTLFINKIMRNCKDKIKEFAYLEDSIEELSMLDKAHAQANLSAETDMVFAYLELANSLSNSTQKDKQKIKDKHSALYTNIKKCIAGISDVNLLLKDAKSIYTEIHEFLMSILLDSNNNGFKVIIALKPQQQIELTLAKSDSCDVAELVKNLKDTNNTPDKIPYLIAKIMQCSEESLGFIQSYIKFLLPSTGSVYISDLDKEGKAFEDKLFRLQANVSITRFELVINSYNCYNRLINLFSQYNSSSPTLEMTNALLICGLIRKIYIASADMNADDKFLEINLTEDESAYLKNSGIKLKNTSSLLEVPIEKMREFIESLQKSLCKDEQNDSNNADVKIDLVFDDNMQYKMQDLYTQLKSIQDWIDKPSNNMEEQLINNKEMQQLNDVLAYYPSTIDNGTVTYNIQNNFVKNLARVYHLLVFCDTGNYTLKSKDLIFRKYIKEINQYQPDTQVVLCTNSNLSKSQKNPNNKQYQAFKTYLTKLFCYDYLNFSKYYESYCNVIAERIDRINTSENESIYYPIITSSKKSLDRYNDEIGKILTRAEDYINTSHDILQNHTIKLQENMSNNQDSDLLTEIKGLKQNTYDWFIKTKCIMGVLLELPEDDSPQITNAKVCFLLEGVFDYIVLRYPNLVKDVCGISSLVDSYIQNQLTQDEITKLTNQLEGLFSNTTNSKQSNGFFSSICGFIKNWFKAKTSAEQSTKISEKFDDLLTIWGKLIVDLNQYLDELYAKNTIVLLTKVKNNKSQSNNSEEKSQSNGNNYLKIIQNFYNKFTQKKQDSSNHLDSEYKDVDVWHSIDLTNVPNITSMSSAKKYNSNINNSDEKYRSIQYKGSGSKDFHQQYGGLIKKKLNFDSSNASQLPNMSDKKDNDGISFLSPNKNNNDSTNESDATRTILHGFSSSTKYSSIYAEEYFSPSLNAIDLSMFKELFKLDSDGVLEKLETDKSLLEGCASVIEAYILYVTSSDDSSSKDDVKDLSTLLKTLSKSYII